MYCVAPRDVVNYSGTVFATWLLRSCVTTRVECSVLEYTIDKHIICPATLCCALHMTSTIATLTSDRGVSHVHVRSRGGLETTLLYPHLSTNLCMRVTQP